MRIFITLALACTVAQAASINEENHWNSFKANHSKSYSSAEEEDFRKMIFLDNKNMIEEHNMRYHQGLVSFLLAINHFADWTLEEMEQLFKGFNSESELSGDPYVQDGIEVPDTIDWRTLGAVTPVKSQGKCRSCWAYSAAGSIEGQYFLKTGNLVSLSEQQMIDCSFEYGNNGCKGGGMTKVLNYVKDRGIESDRDYPHANASENCRHSLNRSITYVTGYVSLPPNDEETLKNAVFNVGPIAAAIATGNGSMLFYKKGIYDNPDCGRKMSHGILVVGYGTENGHDYWLLKNSWGPYWGEQGYMKLSRNKNNQCKISTHALFPTLNNM